MPGMKGSRYVLTRHLSAPQFRGAAERGIAVMPDHSLRYGRRPHSALTPEQSKYHARSGSARPLYRFHRSEFGPKSKSRKTIRAVACAGKGRVPYRVNDEVQCLLSRPKVKRVASLFIQARAQATKEAWDYGVFSGQRPGEPWKEGQKNWVRNRTSEILRD